MKYLHLLIIFIISSVLMHAQGSKVYDDLSLKSKILNMDKNTPSIFHRVMKALNAVTPFSTCCMAAAMTRPAGCSLAKYSRLPIKPLRKAAPPP